MAMACSCQNPESSWIGDSRNGGASVPAGRGGRGRRQGYGGGRRFGRGHRGARSPCGAEICIRSCCLHCKLSCPCKISLFLGDTILFSSSLHQQDIAGTDRVSYVIQRKDSIKASCKAAASLMLVMPCFCDFWKRIFQEELFVPNVALTEIIDILQDNGMTAGADEFYIEIQGRGGHGEDYWVQLCIYITRTVHLQDYSLLVLACA